jgi:ADP-ribose pyrophosphatase
MALQTASTTQGSRASGYDGMQPTETRRMSTTTLTLHEGRFLRLCQRGRWEFVERTNASCAVIIVAVTPDQEVLFVEQYREAIGCKTIEMPAGLVGDIDASESIELAAERELLEETGWSCDRVETLMSGPSSSGMSNEMIVFARAQGLRHVGPGGGDASEAITVHCVPLTSAAHWLNAQRLAGFSIDPKLYAGLYFTAHDPDGSPISP